MDAGNFKNITKRGRRMEQDMHRTELRALTTEELLRHVYAMNYNVPVQYVQELHDRLIETLDIAQGLIDMGADPRQLELPL